MINYTLRLANISSVVDTCQGPRVAAKTKRRDQISISHLVSCDTLPTFIAALTYTSPVGFPSSSLLFLLPLYLLIVDYNWAIVVFFFSSLLVCYPDISAVYQPFVPHIYIY